MSDKKKPQVTLKRRVAIKAIVTDQFKQYLNLELQETLRFGEQRLLEIEAQLNDPKLESVHAQLEAEKLQIQATKDNESAQRDMINNLQNESIFNQGAIDGFVSVSEGDNLYEKLGGMEILVKDGVIQKISPVTQPPQG